MFHIHCDADIVTFRYYNRGLDLTAPARLREEWDNVLKHLLDFTPRKGSQRSGLMCIKKEAWKRVGGFQDRPDFEEQFIMHSGLVHEHVISTTILHLRTGYSKEKQLLQGVARKRARYPLWKTIGHVYLHFKPYVLVGYLNEK
jgi:hypothetical protein